MINNTVKELNLGITIISNTLASFQMERRLDKVGLNLKVGIMKVILKTENLKAKASITFLILGSSTKATSKKTTWMEKAPWFGLMALDTMAISNPAKQKAKAKKNSPTEIDTLANGKTTFKPAAESFTATKTKQNVKDNGKTARDTVG